MRLARSRTAASARAFSMIELVMVIAIIGIIAGIAVPRMSRASVTARENALVSNLSLMQSAIDRYTAEHCGLSPGHSAGHSVDTSGLAFAERLTARTDDDGDADADGVFGPYLRAIPKNPVSGLRTVRIDGAAAGAGTHGWRYDAASQVIQSDHAAGGTLGGDTDLGRGEVKLDELSEGAKALDAGAMELK